MKSKRTIFSIIAAGVLITSVSCAKTTPKKTNILFCVGDDITWKHLGAYGCNWIKTPGFDRVAKNGILFTNAYTTNAKCAPSRSSMLTGRNSWQLEAACNHIPFFPDKFKTYAEVLGENGYHVGYTGKGWSPGIVGKINGIQRSLPGKEYSLLKLKPPTTEISDIDYSGNFEAFLNDNPKNEPFCFWYGSNEPHRGYEFMSGSKLGGKKTSEIDDVPKFWPDCDSVRQDMLDYAFEIEWFDMHLQKMLDILEKRGELENTMVVVCADNGMPFPRIKGQAYEYSNHLPLAIMWAKEIRNPGRVVTDFINYSDFAPTFLEAAGLNGEEKGMQPITGKSLVEIFKSDKSGVVIPSRDHALIGKERHDIGRPHDWGYPIRGIVKGDFLYVHNFEITRWPAGNPEAGYLNCDGSPTKSVILNTRKNPATRPFWQINFGYRHSDELYNIKKDPSCVENLAADTAYSETIKTLQSQLFAELKAQGDPRMFGQGHIFDEYPYAFDNGRNFYERKMKGEEIKASWVIISDYEPNFNNEEASYEPYSY